MKKIPHNVIILGIVSFFNDLAAEMIYPIVPIFLTTVLKTSVPILGLIEGIAEATAAVGKYLFGTLSDYFQRRKIFVTLGYSFGAVSKILIGLAQSWPLVLFARFIDRTGKGLRTAPRDSILFENTTNFNRGFIFGFHRSLDSLGAVFGPILGLMLLYFLKENMRLVFFLAFIPSVFALILLIIAVKEKSWIKTDEERHFVKINFRSINPHLKLFLLVSFIFALGNSSDAFLILRAKNLGLTTILVTLTYVLYNISQAVFATPAGKLADKIGAKKVFALGLFIFSAVYFSFGIIKNPIFIWFIFPIYGIYIAFTDGVSKAYLSEFIDKKESGSYFGLHQTLIAVGAFLASAIGGILWNKINPSATFYYGSLMAALALLIFLFSHRFQSKSLLEINK
ncbi:MFS transporter [Candidatus Roizmanbacteria bacterium CG_4_9_14_0_2_um_filter_36_12]|uniref:MFS transporter n=3 Tax=Candidatus Roizmaniibacteriota TaxID=1752723 RepID=A0A2M8EZK0_9BACT|nr:MAG: MFS transporter [Candidatus Roizmanbacteria bacterium CG_4_9_14_0_2_um_filter_36_12]